MCLATSTKRVIGDGHKYGQQVIRSTTAEMARYEPTGARLRLSGLSR